MIVGSCGSNPICRGGNISLMRTEVRDIDTKAYVDFQGGPSSTDAQLLVDQFALQFDSMILALLDSLHPFRKDKGSVEHNIGYQESEKNLAFIEDNLTEKNKKLTKEGPIFCEYECPPLNISARRLVTSDSSPS